MMSRVSTRVRFVLAMMLLLVPVIAIAAIILDESFKRSQEQIITSEFATADVVSQSVSELIKGQQQALGVLAETEAIRSLDKQKDVAAAQMDEYRVSRQSVNGLFLLKNDLTVVAQSGGIDIGSLPPEFKAAAEAAVQGGQATVSDALLLQSGEVKVIAIIVPVYANLDATTPEAPSGAIGAFYSVERLIAGFQPPAGFTTGSHVAIALVSSMGRVVSVPGGTSDPSQIFQDGPALNTAIKTALANQRTRATFTDPTGLSRVTVAVPIDMPGNDWAVLVSAPETTSYGPTRMLIERALIALVGVLALSFLLAVLLAEWLARPFRLLTSQAKALSTGSVVLDLEPVGPSDAATLSRTIREMADRLRARSVTPRPRAKRSPARPKPCATCSAAPFGCRKTSAAASPPTSTTLFHPSSPAPSTRPRPSAWRNRTATDMAMTGMATATVITPISTAQPGTRTVSRKSASCLNGPCGSCTTSSSTSARPTSMTSASKPLSSATSTRSTAVDLRCTLEISRRGAPPLTRSPARDLPDRPGSPA